MRPTVLIVFSLVLAASLSAAETYIVRPDGTGDFPTIGAAVQAAADGDVIELTDGTFTGPGNRDINLLGKALTIRSQAGDPRYCRIDCERQARGFWGDMSARLEGFTITGGQSPDFGGAIAIFSGSLTAVGCIFSDNHAPGNGGAVFIDMCSPVTFIECDFIGNVGGPGGAICT